jgi:eukaryotic-like serine/threonine-protein kinase
MTTPSQELLPLLVADLGDAASIDVLRSIAIGHQTVLVPLVTAPVDRRWHVLEACCEHGGESITARFLAEPVGPPMEEGFPLRLRPYAPHPPSENASADHDDGPTIQTQAPFFGRRGETSPTSPRMTKRHTRDLEGDAAPTQEAEHIGRKLAGGKYRLDELVGRGGMGVVYRAHHADLDRSVAVKVLHSSLELGAASATQLRSEALTMSRIDHPNVTRILDFGEEPDGLVYLAMEFLDGVELEGVIRREGRLPLDRLLRIVVQVTSALGHVHRHGIIHRDVKPSNIVLVAGHDEDDDTPTETVKVCDFGLALARGSAGRVAGTPEYMSPEQCSAADIDARSDVYSCGVVLYELATGALPFRGDTATILRAHVSKPPPPPSLVTPDIDPLLESVILRALSKRPADRQPSMRHLRAELKDLLAPVFVETSPAPPPSSVRDIDVAPAPSSTRADPVAPSLPQGRTSSSAERWFADDGSGAVSITTLASLTERHAEFSDGDLLAKELSRNPKPILASMFAVENGNEFAEAAKALQQAVRKLLSRSDTATLSAVIHAMRNVIKEERAIAPPGVTSVRMKWAGRVLRVLREPGRLAELVDLALGGDEPSPSLRHLFVETQEAGAEALVVGRRDRHAGRPQARSRFVALTKTIGPGALAILRAALHREIERGERGGAFVDDLLLAIPPFADETTGAVVAELLRNSPPPTMSTALVALAHLWGDRARPLLLGALRMGDPIVEAAALTGLQQLRAIDEAIVAHIDRLLVDPGRAPENLLAIAAAALADTTPSARASAAALLLRTFARAPRVGASPSFVVAVARSLLALGEPRAAALIKDRAEGSPEPLRGYLLALVRTSTR